jgi:hypothetical protein
MGKANDVTNALRRPAAREFVIDTETGVITQENLEPEVSNRPAPAQVQAAHVTYD